MPTFDQQPPIGEEARAKVNLTLSVRGRRADGYHELESLVAFAGVHDTLTLRPGPPGRLDVGGTFAAAIVGENLLARTVALLQAADPHLRIGAVHLDKALPVAAGLGGGSADAAALLRAVRRANPDRAGAIPWHDIAARLGSDVPVCLAGQPALIQGRGERMRRVPDLPDLHAVLVNLRLPLSTASVFAALQARPVEARDDPDEPIPHLASIEAVLSYMREQGNDLEPPATALVPEIASAKAHLARQAGCRHAIMSGSGPTCVGIFATAAEARRAAAAIAAARPEWWVEATMLIGTREPSGAPDPGSPNA